MNDLSNLAAKTQRSLRRRDEDRLQRAVFDHLRRRGVPGHVAFAIPNGGARSPAEAAILVGLGVLAGVPDIFLFLAGKAFALEIKTERGQLSQHQRDVQSRLSAAGVTVATSYGLDEALAFLESWGLLRGRASRARSA